MPDPDQKALPDPVHAEASPPPQPVIVRPTAAALQVPDRQLAGLPYDELAALAEDLGLDPTRHKTVPGLVAAIFERRQLIETLDREAMMDIVRWGRRPVPANASRQLLATEIARVKRMRFEGLSDEGLRVLALLRGCRLKDDESRHRIVKLLNRREGLLAKMGRKRRALVGGLLERALGNGDEETPYEYLPDEPEPAPAAKPRQAGAARPRPDAARPRPEPIPEAGRLKHEIEESGLFGGLTNRIKKTADAYLNQKLDEVEARIDRKLDEIDRRLAEWRDKEIANRIRILKITLWVSLIVGAFSLIYSYFTTHVM